MLSKKSETKGQNSLTLHEVVDHVGIVTMNNGSKLNTLSSQMVRGILDSLSRFESMDIHAVILRAASGARVWSAGHNINEIPPDGQDPVNWNVPFEKLLHRVRNFPMPIIGMIEGSVWGSLTTPPG